jgi:3-hydroxyisobutyrate dehydrogenase-like beta-hydroxyacid dehydrogenase
MVVGEREYQWIKDHPSTNGQEGSIGIIMDRIDVNTQLGFVGVGAMGSRIVRRLLAGGYKVAVYDLSREKAQALVIDGATISNSPADLASTAGIILSCLTNDEAVRRVYLGPDGLLFHAAAGTVVVEMSTIRPRTSREVAREGADRGVPVLDVAISGSTPAVEQGTVTLLGGGDSTIFAALEPIFKTIAKACALGEKEGLDRDQLLTVLGKTAVVAPAHVGKLPRAMRNDYSPQFPLRLMNKDFRLILEAASQSDLALPATEAAFQVNSDASIFWPDLDFSVVIQEMESRAHK